MHWWEGCAVWAGVASLLTVAWQTSYNKWINSIGNVFCCLTKEKICVKGWAGFGNGALTETKTRLIWIEGLLRSFRQQSIDRGFHPWDFVLFSLGYLLRFGGTEPCTESKSAHSLLRSSQDGWQQVREMSMLLRCRLVSKVWRWNHGLRASESLNGCMVGHQDMPRLIFWRADQCTIRRSYKRYQSLKDIEKVLQF